MTRRPKPPPPPQQADLSVEQMQLAIPRLKKRISQLVEFQPEAIKSSEEARALTGPLNDSIDDALTRTFGSDTVEYRRYQGAGNLSWPIRLGGTVPLHVIIKSLVEDKTGAIASLNTAIESLEERLEESGGQIVPDVAPERSRIEKTRKVFVVHGHDVGTREAVARFLEKLQFEPVVLHEQPNRGKTIIEKFEANADVGFAVVLLTPDDLVVGEDGKSVSRTRQNVILELGYFIGRLGRDRVCALKRGDVELPSDILGVVWIDFDTSDAWHMKLAKELQAAGYKVDWNKMMRS